MPKLDTLTHDGSRFVWIGDFHSKDIPKGASFQYAPDHKIWWTIDAPKAHKLKNYADEAALARLVDYEHTIAASRATSAEGVFPVPDGLSYLPYQKAGIQFALAHKNILFGDEMGLGKTIQAIGTINTDESITSVLIVCPASLKINWQRELSKWLVRGHRTAISIANGGDFPRTAIVIINYDILTKHQAAISSREWDLLVIDESHYIKNGKAQRTKALVGYWDSKKKEVVPGIIDKCAKRMFLTGTPLPNKPIELWTTVNALAPDTFKSVMGFGKRYCGGFDGEHGWDFTGSSNQEELQAKMRELFMVRRLKEQVLKELPAKVRQVIPLAPPPGLDLTEGVTALKEYLVLANDALNTEYTVEAHEEEMIYMDAGHVPSRKRILFEEISRVRHTQAVAKIPDVVSHLQDCFESGVEKIVCFAHHRDVIETIQESFPGSVKLYGGMSAVSKDEAVHKFQNNPDCKLFIGAFLTAGVGLTLTASSHVVFAELDWVPGNISQAEDRCHRIGQEDTVLVQHLVIAGSIDDMMVKKIISKQEIIHRTMDKVLACEDDSDVLPVQEIKRPESHAPRADGAVIDERFDYASADLTVEQVAAMKKAVEWLTGRCDGAVEEDGMGFNGMDTHRKNTFTLALLESDRWSVKMAVAAKKMLRKYRNTQIPMELVEIIWAEERITA